MKNENSTPTGVRTGYTRVVVMILLLVLLTQVLGDDRSPRGPGPRRDPVPSAQKDRIVGRLTADYGLCSQAVLSRCFVHVCREIRTCHSHQGWLL